VPYLRTLLMWHCVEPRERSLAALLSHLVELLAQPPSPEPTTHLDLDAAVLYFSRSDDDKKEYKKRAKKRVQQSVDG